MEGEVLTEVPTCLQKLVQMVVRGFYTVEDMLIIDMLVRNLCLSEDSICDLLKFDRKMLRQRINTLKTDKLLQTKMKMITVEDGKSQREQYYFINYKSFVNVVKYKLDHIRKKLEMEERDQTSRASFVCSNCQRTYTDLEVRVRELNEGYTHIAENLPRYRAQSEEADQLLDPMTGMLVCIICKTEVQEDMSAAPRSDSRLLLTRFNEQLEPLFTLLKEVENIKLAAEFSDPNPQELSINKKAGVNRHIKSAADSRAWSGDATKRQGFQVEGSIDVTINTENTVEETQKAKEEPAWLSQASSFITAQITTEETDSSQAADGAGAASGPSMSTAVGPTAVVETVAKVGPTDVPQKDDVLSLLEAHEPKSKKNGDNSDSDDSVEELPKKQPAVVAPFTYNEESLEGMLDSDEETEGDNVPLISVGGERIPLTAVDNAVISRMTQQEKNLYINVYQEYMTGMEDL